MTRVAYVLVLGAGVSCLISPCRAVDFVPGLPGAGIDASVPPAAIVVEDEMGRRTGVDTSAPISIVGQGSEIDEIPRARLTQTNIGSDDLNEVGALAPTTYWAVTIGNIGSEQYRVRLLGLRSGIATVKFVLMLHGGRKVSMPVQDVEVLVSPGATRYLTAAFDPDAKTITTTRSVSGANLAEDTATACSLGMIKTPGICRSLQAKADAAAADLARGNSTSAHGGLSAFMKELDAQAGKHVEGPAYSILREEVGALLAGTPARKIARQRVRKHQK